MCGRQRKVHRWRVVRVGLRSTTGNRVSRKTASRVRIPCSPPSSKAAGYCDTAALLIQNRCRGEVLGRIYRAYITAQSLEILRETDYFSYVSDLFNTPQVQSLGNYEQHLEFDRLKHVVTVSYLTFLVCSKLRLDKKTASRAAILHDLYYYDWRENDWCHRPHGYLHPTFAIKNAETLLGKLDKKTRNIILRHMWPLTLTPPTCKEAFVVSLADKYCAAIELLISLSPSFRQRFKKDVTNSKKTSTIF